MRFLLVQCVARFHAEGALLRRLFTTDRAAFSAQAALFIGLAYQFGPIDLIPNRIPVVGHADEFAFLLSGFLLARRLAPPIKRAARSCRAIVPNFFIVGAPRCGTTSLFDALGEHPDVFCCPVKEPNHFATELRERPWVMESARRRGVLIEPGSAALTVLPRVAITPDYDVYLRLFEDWAGQRAVGEASTAYLLSPRAAAAIAGRQPDARIIVVLRQPVERARSEIQMHAQLGRKLGDDEYGLPKTIRTSLYAPQIRRYLEIFAREQILFLLFEDMMADPAGSLRAVFTHIGVDPVLGDGIVLKHHNQSRPVRFAGLNALLFRSGLRDVLAHVLPRMVREAIARWYYARSPRRRPARVTLSLFRDDIAETGRLIGRDLSHWLAAGEGPS
jgi:uncharacterized membrane protein YkvA (DUF1232 family)